MEWKGFRIVADGTYGLYAVKFVGRGLVPKALQGTYTKTSLAKSAIDAYLDSKGANKNGEEKQRD